MFTSSLLVTILRELLPFLKEALLEGQSFKVWLKTNWLTFAWLINMFFLTLLIAALSDTVTATVRREAAIARQLQTIHAPLLQMIDRYKHQRDERAVLLARIAELEAAAAQNQTTLDQYEEWMGKCEVNFEDRGQCKVVRQSPARTPNRSTSPNRPVKPPIDPPQEQPPATQTEQQKPGFLYRLRNAFRRDSPDENKDGP